MSSVIQDFSVLNFSGGVRRDKSLFELRKNELADARNVEILENGRLRTRRGSQQVGQTLAGNIDGSFFFQRSVAGSSPAATFIINNTAATTVFDRLIRTRLTAAVAVGDTTITVNTTNLFTASGTIEIDGDLIAYTGITATTFTGVTGVTSAHLSGQAVHQWSALTPATAVDGRMGIYYTVVSNRLIICGRGGGTNGWQQINNDDGTTMTNVASQPAGLFITNYRDRAYVAGDGGSGTNADPRRISFSARTDATSWTTASDFFDVEDQRGEYIHALRVLNDRLGIFKTNSIFTYDEIELKQRISDVGAFNHKVPQEINGLIYTFCPNGIFATNLSEATQIGDPVKQYWKNFNPTYDSIGSRVCTNTWAARFEDRYLLYIQDVTDPTSTNDVVLDYHTKNKTWTVHHGYTDFQHLNGFQVFVFGDGVTQVYPGLFGGDNTGKFYRLFENRYLDGQATRTRQGTDIFQDLISDTGTPVPSVIETPMYDMDHPDMFKKGGQLRVYAEQGEWQVAYRIENERGISEYRNLGKTFQTNTLLKFPSNAEGWRIGLQFTSSSINGRSVLNGFVFEQTVVTRGR